MRTRLLIICVMVASAGLLAYSETVSALDPFPRRSILGYTEWQNRQNQQSQQLRQLMNQRDVQRLREDQMSRNVERQLDMLKRRQVERELLRNVRGPGTIDRVLMMPDSLRSSARKPESAPKTAAANGNQTQSAAGAKKDTTATDTTQDTGTPKLSDRRAPDEP